MQSRQLTHRINLVPENMKRSAMPYLQYDTDVDRFNPFVKNEFFRMENQIQSNLISFNIISKLTNQYLNLLTHQGQWSEAGNQWVLSEQTQKQLSDIENNIEALCTAIFGNPMPST